LFNFYILSEYFALPIGIEPIIVLLHQIVNSDLAHLERLEEQSIRYFVLIYNIFEMSPAKVQLNNR